MTENEFFTRLASRAQREFNDVGDYIWKSTDLTIQHRAIELDKLDAYFPDADSDTKEARLRALRWSLEAHKLDTLFPHLFATANLFCATALLELYCLELINELQTYTGPLPSNGRASAVRRVQQHLSTLNLTSAHLPVYGPVLAALDIRNCFIHANGVLAFSRNEPKLRNIVDNLSYLSREHVVRRRRNGLAFDDVVISTTAIGEALKIDNLYAHVANYYFQQYVIGVCSILNEANLHTLN